MSNTAIKIENLTKEYRLGLIGHGSLREDIQSAWAKVRGKEDPNSLVTTDHNKDSDKKHFLALDDVSCEIKKGERIGLIGKNGAGKSTLLKVLSRITAPTKGSVFINGRIGSLLEVGTGFHGELTGRENIYLNGAIMGMKKWEIDKKFDEIVDFSGVERFIDTPVKRYSSGMFVRLGFAVAAHLEPEILIVDEVLAVGDAEFQKKALGKMENVSNDEGRTIIFVSHNMNSINTLCSKSILLVEGAISMFGETTEVINKYYETSGYLTMGNLDKRVSKKLIGDEFCNLLSAEVLNSKGKRTNDLVFSEPITIRMKYRIRKKSDMIIVPNFHFKTIEGVSAFVDNAPGMTTQEPGDYTAECIIPGKFLNEGVYVCGVAITGYQKNTVHVCFFEEDALTFTIKDLHDDLSNRYGFTGKIPGVVRPGLKWEVTKNL